MLGRAVMRRLKYEKIPADAWTRADGDLSEVDTARWAVQILRPNLVINCAAYTDVEGCEDPANADAMRRGNVLIPQNLAMACGEREVRLVHVSTDYVYDGRKSVPYVEDDPVNPLSNYGRGKLEGEQAVMEAAGEQAIILRTAWLYGPYGKNFVDTIRRLARERDELKVVDDQIGCPTYVDDLADAILRCGRLRATGVFHAVNDGSTSWFGLAKRIVKRLNLETQVHPCTTAEYPTKAARPANSVLSCDKLEAATGLRLRHWEEAVDDYLSGP